jgi:hypothetical protein
MRTSAMKFRIAILAIHLEYRLPWNNTDSRIVPGKLRGVEVEQSQMGPQLAYVLRGV